MRAEKGKLLRIYLGTKDRYKGNLLYEEIVKKAKDLELAGVTVVRGTEGFGANSKEIHRDSILRLSDDLPIIVEIVDIETKIVEAVKDFEVMLAGDKHEALVTVADIEILRRK